MRLHQQEAAESNVQASGAFTINPDAKMFAILSSKLYTNPIRAIVREICTNAHDAHIMAGTPTRPFDVSLSTRLDSTYVVRDYGPGLSEEMVRNIFTCYGKSTKDQSNLFNGALGLGSKSPFGYSPTFSVTSIIDGKSTTYLMYMVDGLPQYTITETVDADDQETGVEIRVPIKPGDEERFRDEALSVISMLELRPNVNGESVNAWLSRNRVTIDASAPIDIGDGITVRTYTSDTAHRIALPNLCVRMAGVVYPINMDLLQSSLSNLRGYTKERAVEIYNLVAKIIIPNLTDGSSRGSVMFDVPTGTVQFTPSREELQYDLSTCEPLVKMFEHTADTLFGSLRSILDDMSLDEEKRITALLKHPLLAIKDDDGAMRWSRDTTGRRTTCVTQKQVAMLKHRGMYDDVHALLQTRMTRWCDTHKFDLIGHPITSLEFNGGLSWPVLKIMPVSSFTARPINSISAYFANSIPVGEFDIDSIRTWLNTPVPTLDDASIDNDTAIKVAEQYVQYGVCLKHWFDSKNSRTYHTKGDGSDEISIRNTIRSIGNASDQVKALLKEKQTPATKAQIQKHSTEWKHRVETLATQLDQYRIDLKRAMFSADFKHMFVPAYIHDNSYSIAIFEREKTSTYSDNLIARIRKEAKMGSRGLMIDVFGRGNAGPLAALLKKVTERSPGAITSHNIDDVYAEMKAARTARKKRALLETKVRVYTPEGGRGGIKIHKWSDAQDEYSKALFVMVTDRDEGDRYETTVTIGTETYKLMPAEVRRVALSLAGAQLVKLSHNPSTRCHYKTPAELFPVVVARPKEYAMLVRKGWTLPTFQDWITEQLKSVSALPQIEQLRIIGAEVLHSGTTLIHNIRNKRPQRFISLIEHLQGSQSATHQQLAQRLSQVVDAVTSKTVTYSDALHVIVQDGQARATCRELICKVFGIDENNSVLRDCATKYPLIAVSDPDLYERPEIITHMLKYIDCVG